jgi:malate synthase
VSAAGTYCTLQNGLKRIQSSETVRTVRDEFGTDERETTVTKGKRKRRNKKADVDKIDKQCRIRKLPSPGRSLAVILSRSLSADEAYLQHMMLRQLRRPIAGANPAWDSHIGLHSGQT